MFAQLMRPCAEAATNPDLLARRQRSPARIRRPVGNDGASPGIVRRKAACGCKDSASSASESAPKAPCAACQQESAGLLQRAPAGVGVTEAPPIVGDVLRSGGKPLDAALRAYFEPRLGQEIGSVRVHTDARADASARAVDARAYTVGHNVVFREGAYSPDTSEGRHLLAHELAHVAQQSSGAVVSGTRPSLMVGSANDPAEREADRVAAEVTRSGSPAPAADGHAMPTPAVAAQAGAVIRRQQGAPRDLGNVDDWPEAKKPEAPRDLGDVDDWPEAKKTACLAKADDDYNRCSDKASTYCASIQGGAGLSATLIGGGIGALVAGPLGLGIGAGIGAAIGGLAAGGVALAGTADCGEKMAKKCRARQTAAKAACERIA